MLTTTLTSVVSRLRYPSSQMGKLRPWGVTCQQPCIVRMPSQVLGFPAHRMWPLSSSPILLSSTAPPQDVEGVQ